MCVGGGRGIRTQKQFERMQGSESTLAGLLELHGCSVPGKIFYTLSEYLFEYINTQFPPPPSGNLLNY